MNELANQIRSKRDKLGQSQEEAAWEIGVTTSTFHRWETGKSEPSRLKLEALSRWLNGKK